MTHSIPPATYGQLFSATEHACIAAVKLGKRQGQQAAMLAVQAGTWHHCAGLKELPLSVLKGLAAEAKALGVANEVAPFLAWGNAILDAWNATGAEVTRRVRSLPTSQVWAS